MNQEKNSRKEKPVKRKRRSFLKFIFHLFLILFILIGVMIAVLVVANLTVDPQLLVNKVSAILKQKYHREIKINRVRLSVFQGIRLNGIRLSKVGGFQNGTVLEFKKGSVIYNPLALLIGELDIIKVSFSGMYTSYDDMMKLIADFSPKHKQKTSLKTQKQKSGSSVFRVKVRRVELLDSQLVYHQIPLNFSIVVNPKAQIDRSHFEIKIFSMYGRVSFAGSLKNGDLIVSDFDVTPFVPGLKNVVIHKIYFVLEKRSDNEYALLGKIVDMSAMGFHIQTYGEFTGSYGIKGQNVLLRNFGLKVNNSKLYIDRMSYFMRSQKLSLSITNVDAHLSDFVHGASGDIDGKLDLEWSRKPLVSGTLQITNLKYAFVRDGNLELQVNQNQVDGSMNLKTSGGSVRATLKSKDFSLTSTVFSVESEKLDLYPILLSWNEISKKLPEKQKSTNEVKKSGFTSLKIPPILFRLRVGKLSFRKYLLENVALNSIFEKGALNIKDFAADFIGGHLSGAGRLVGTTFSGEIVYRNGNLRLFSNRHLTGNKRLYGKINASGKFDFYLDRPMDSIGHFTLDMSGGEIRNFVLLEKMNALLWFIPADDIQYDTISVDAAMRDGILTLKKTDFLSKDLKIYLNGDVNLKKQNDTLNILVFVHKRYLEGGAFIAHPFIPGKMVGDYKRIKVKVHGPFSKPVVKLLN